MKVLFLLVIMTKAAFANTRLGKIQQLITTTEKPVVIFDLDDTLFYSSSRTFIIFKELANSDEFQEKYPDQVKKLLKIKQSEIEYSIKETLTNAGITHEEFLNEALDYWKERFFTDEYVKEDTPVEGGREYVHKLKYLGATIVYLTGRDHTMRAGTIESLENSGFPYDAITSILITKERFDIPDIDYKKAAFKKIDKLGNVVAFFENEPKNLNAMIENFPNAVPVFLDIKHSPAPVKPSEKAIKIKNYIFKPVTSTCLLLN